MKHELNGRMYTRRDFFSLLVPVLSVPVILWWLFTGGRTRTGGMRPADVVIRNEIPAGISFHDNVLLVRRGDEIRAFEARCTHLGCTISRTEGDVLVCQCHGSRFDLDGNPVKGPASEALRELPVTKGSNGETVISFKP